MSTTFPVHTIASAPASSRPLLETLQNTFGFLPNLAGVMAESPTLLGAFVPLFTAVHGGTFTEAEIQTVLLTNAVTNASAWPVALHSLLARKAGVADADVDAIRAGDLPADRRLGALSALARALIEARGLVDSTLVDAFLDAGFRRDQALEILAISAASTLTNFVSGVARQPLDPQIAAETWHPAR